VKPAFSDVSSASGIRFRHHSGADRRKFMPETVGSGCAFLDYNGDGRLDVFFVNGTDWPGPAAKPHRPALYRNNGGGAFTDVTVEAGLAQDTYGMGAAVADYDNDGHPDLYLTCLGPNHLYHNNRDGTFADVTARSGTMGEPVEPGGTRWKWSTSAAWFDYDRDGRLDLYVANYVRWTPKTDVYCATNGVKGYCAPDSYEGVPSLLYHNEGDGHFKEVGQATGIGASMGKSFGVAAADYNEDGWPDLAIANDTTDNFLFVNQAGRGFEERGLEAGLARSRAGITRAGMGIDVADWQNNGRLGLVIGNFAREGLALFEGLGDGSFREVSAESGVGPPSLLYLTFGTFFFDYDLDGWQDLFAANGHIDDFIELKDAAVGYEEVPLLFRGGPEHHFQNVGSESGPAFAKRRVLRGAARGDYDNDGDPDIAVVWNNRSGELWRNDGGNSRAWIGLALRGTRSNRDGIGAVVRMSAGRQTQTACRRSGGSFLSESDPRLHFGLGSASSGSIEIRWPSGSVSRFADVKAGRYYLAEEGQSKLEALDNKGW
jgi:enediyne biosynthesis protein E4